MGAITRGIANNILGSGAVDGTDALTGTIPATNIGNPSLANLTTFPPSVDTGSIPQVAGDPPSPSDGDVWYNTNTYKLKVRGVSAAAGSWATGTNINTARQYVIGIGTYDSSLAVGGNDPASPGELVLTESWNGSSWTEVNDVNTARFGATSAGVSNTSGLIFMGQDTTLGPPTTPNNTSLTESWNGTSWTEVNDLNSDRQDGGGFGTQTSALTFGGYKYLPSGGVETLTESWNGTSWTEVGDLNTARYKLSESGAGATNTAGICAGGDTLSGDTTATESWNGTSWTEVNDMNLVRDNLGACGTQTAALAFGGEEDSPDAYYAQTEEWNGTSWTEVADLNSGRTRLGSSGSTSTALAIGGNPGTAVTAATEEWNAGADNLNVDLA